MTSAAEGADDPLLSNPMTITNIVGTIAQVDASYDPDPAGMIDMVGHTVSGHQVDLLLVNTGDGPALWPGHSSCLHCDELSIPLLRSVKEWQPV